MRLAFEFRQCHASIDSPRGRGPDKIEWPPVPRSFRREPLVGGQRMRTSHGRRVSGSRRRGL